MWSVLCTSRWNNSRAPCGYFRYHVTCRPRNAPLQSLDLSYDQVRAQVPVTTDVQKGAASLHQSPKPLAGVATLTAYVAGRVRQLIPPFTVNPWTCEKPATNSNIASRASEMAYFVP
uniref:Transposase n=1 Tax=Mesocestoides corti TaxID=53468 RepID=A0A5K3EW00_MESCO